MRPTKENDNIRRNAIFEAEKRYKKMEDKFNKDKVKKSKKSGK